MFNLLKNYVMKEMFLINVLDDSLKVVSGYYFARSEDFFATYFQLLQRGRFNLDCYKKIDGKFYLGRKYRKVF